MTKPQKILLNISSLFFLNIAFWICNIYPRHILEFSGYAVIAIVLNFIYFAIYAFMLVIIFSKSATLFSERIFVDGETKRKRFCLDKMVTIIAIQILVDLFHLLFGTMESPYSLMITDFLMLCQWGVVYWILIRNEKTPLKSKLTWSKLVLVLGGICVLFLLLDYRLIADYQAVGEKYLSDSTYFKIYQTNFDFIHSLYALLMDCVVACTFVIFHVLYSEKENLPKKRDKRGGWTIVGFQIVLLFLTTFVLVAGKTMVFPYSCIKSFDIDSGIHHYHEKDGSYYCNEYTTEIYRLGDTFLPVLCYHSTKVEIFSDQKKKGEFHYIDISAPAWNQEENTIIMSSNFIEYSVNNVTVYVNPQGAIGFYENGKSRTILFEEIEDCEENEILIGVCEQLLSEGNITIFEYAVEYLYEYDQEFILSYLERYAQGNFTDRERQWMEASYYRSEYIVDIAKQFSQG